MANQKFKKADAESLRVNEKKWSKTLMDAGWSAVPNIIIEKQEALGLKPIELNIIMHLIHYWWHPDNLPHPSVETIAKAVGVTPRTIQRNIRSLVDLGFMEREERRHTRNGSITNKYGFDGLIEKAKPYAKEKLAERAKAARAKRDRVARKKPRLVVDNDG